MPEINENQPVRNEPINHHNNDNPPENREAPTAPRAQRAENATTRREEVRQYGDEQRLRLNNSLPPNEREEEGGPNGLIAGGVAGSTAAQFAQREVEVRGSGRITIRDTDLGYDWNTNQFTINPNSNTADFVSKVEQDLNRIAPGTRVIQRPDDPRARGVWDLVHGSDTAAIIEPAPVGERVSGHEAGYRLVDQLKNNPRQVAIHLYPGNDNAFAAPRFSSSDGTVTNPADGSPVDISYNPDARIDLTVRDSNGQIRNVPTDPSIIFGHEANHASHMQRGTANSTAGDGGRGNFISLDGRNYREANNLSIGLREEFRTVGVSNGHVYGSEPTENALRAEQGTFERRVSYQGQGSYQPLSSLEAFAGRTSNRFQNAADVTIDGVRGSRNSALLGGGFSAATALYRGEDAQGVLTETALGVGSGVTEEVIERAVNGPRATTSGMTANNFRAAASQVRGAAVAGAIINTAFTVHDQWDNLQNDATRSQAVGTIAGEAVVGAASGAAGAYAGAMAGAAIGSIVPGVGTVIGGVVGFAVGAAAGYLADQGLRGLGVDRMVAGAVTATYDAVSNVASQAGEAIGNAASNVAEGARNFFSGAASTLSSVFG